MSAERVESPASPRPGWIETLLVELRDYEIQKTLKQQDDEKQQRFVDRQEVLRKLQDLGLPTLGFRLDNPYEFEIDGIRFRYPSNAHQLRRPQLRVVTPCSECGELRVTKEVVTRLELALALREITTDETREDGPICAPCLNRSAPLTAPPAATADGKLISALCQLIREIAREVSS